MHPTAELIERMFAKDGVFDVLQRQILVRNVFNNTLYDLMKTTPSTGMLQRCKEFVSEIEKYEPILLHLSQREIAFLSYCNWKHPDILRDLEVNNLRAYLSGHNLPADKINIIVKRLRGYACPALDRVEIYTSVDQTSDIPRIFDAMLDDTFNHCIFAIKFERAVDYFAHILVTDHPIYRGIRGAKSGCVKIAIPDDTGDVWVAIRLGYNEGKETFRRLSGSEISAGLEETGFEWNPVREFLARLSSATEASQHRREEGNTKVTQCVWIKTIAPGEDVLLGFCVEFDQGLALRDQLCSGEFIHSQHC